MTTENKNNKINLFDIFYVFLKIGIVLVGGGYVILPLLNSEIVEKKRWMSYDDILDKYCLSQCIPGIIVANTALFVGYKLRGFLGAIAAIVGVTISAFITIISIANILSIIFNNDNTTEIIDVKGVRTKEYIAKKKMFEDKYNLKIKEIN